MLLYEYLNEVLHRVQYTKNALYTCILIVLKLKFDQKNGAKFRYVRGTHDSCISEARREF